MSIYDPNWLKHYFRTDPDEELSIKLVFAETATERDMLKLEIERREKEHAKPSERVL